MSTQRHTVFSVVLALAVVSSALGQTFISKDITYLKGGTFDDDIFVVSDSTLSILNPDADFSLPSNTLYLGAQKSSGTLTIESGGVMRSLAGLLGDDGGSAGTATVDGSLWEMKDALTIGRAGESTGTVSILNGGTVSNANAVVAEQAGSKGSVTVTGTGSTWTNSGTLTVGDEGAGTLVIDGGTISTTGTIIGASSGGSGLATLDGSTAKWTETSDATVGRDGTGTLKLSNDATFSVNGGKGTLTLGSEKNGSGTLIIGSTPNSKEPLERAGIVDAATIAGGNGHGLIRINSSDDKGTFTYFTRDGTVAGAGVNTSGPLALEQLSGSTVFTGDLAHTGGTTISGGLLQIGAGGATGTLTGDVANHASLAFNRSEDLTYSGLVSGTGSLAQLGTGTLTLSGANSYSGGTTISFGTVTTGHATALGTGTVAVSGSTAILNLARTYVTNAVALTSSGTLTGSGGVGTLSAASGGTISPGDSPGTLAAGNTTFAGGGTYTWEINNAKGVAGTNFDLLSISGSLAITATGGSRFTINLTSLLANNTPGDVINFNSTQNHSYTIATASSGITGFSTDAFTLNATNFTNALNGGTWSLAQSGNNLNLNFTANAIPEPSTYAAIFGAVTLALAIYRRRQEKQV